jgi:hypothetical protein
MISSIFYAFFAAFRHDIDYEFNADTDTGGRRESMYFSDAVIMKFNYMQLFFEMIFLVQTSIGFITEFVPKNATNNKPERRLHVIAVNYF